MAKLPHPGSTRTRPGNSIAATWAVFNFLGQEGYTKLSKKSFDLTNHFISEISKIPGFESPTKPKINIASVVSRTMNMDAVKQSLTELHWYFYNVNGPPLSRNNAFAVGIVPYHEKILPEFLGDLQKIGTKYSQH